MKIRQLFTIEKNPRKGLYPLEWVVLVYMALTLLLVLFCTTKVQNPDAMVWGRVRIAALAVGVWVVYRLVPCRLTQFLRVLFQMLLLGWWYGDTYNLNTLFANQDHIVASWDQAIFGFQPALRFAEVYPQAWISEILEIAYACYFPVIIMVCVFYFFARYKEFERCCFIVMASFFTYYIIFDLFPVTGPMYYFHAIGLDKVAHGVFPCLGDYFRTHTEMMAPPGYHDGIGYALLQAVHAGEHPTAAFPSSHVGITVVCLMLAIHSRNKTLSLIVLSLVILICFATVYTRAHYAIDSMMGLVSGLLFYFLWMGVSRKYKL